MYDNSNSIVKLLILLKRLFVFYWNSTMNNRNNCKYSYLDFHRILVVIFYAWHNYLKILTHLQLFIDILSFLTINDNLNYYSLCQNYWKINTRFHISKFTLIFLCIIGILYNIYYFLILLLLSNMLSINYNLIGHR